MRSKVSSDFTGAAAPAASPAAESTSPKNLIFEPADDAASPTDDAADFADENTFPAISPANLNGAVVVVVMSRGSCVAISLTNPGPVRVVSTNKSNASLAASFAVFGLDLPAVRSNVGSTVGKPPPSCAGVRGLAPCIKLNGAPIVPANVCLTI